MLIRNTTANIEELPDLLLDEVVGGHGNASTSDFSVPAPQLRLTDDSKHNSATHSADVHDRIFGPVVRE